MKYDYWLINRQTLDRGRLEQTLNEMGHLGWRLNHFGYDYLVFEKESSGNSLEIETLTKSMTLVEEEAQEERIYA